MLERAPGVQNAIFPPLPHTERGFTFQLGSCPERKTHNRGPMVVYPNGRFVIMREMNDMTKTMVFAEHKEKVLVAKANPKGTRIASGDESGKVIIWEILKDGRISVRDTYPINTGIRDIAWSPDGQRLVVAGDSNGDSFVVAFLVNTGSTLGAFMRHTSRVLSVSYKPTRPYRVVSGGEDRLVAMHEGPPFQFLQSQSHHSNYVTKVEYRPDGEQFFSTGNDGKLYFYDGKTGEKTGTFKMGDKKQRHGGTIAGANWGPDGKQILTAGADRVCKLWDVDGKIGTLNQTFKMNVEDQKRPEIRAMQVASVWQEGKMITVSLSGAINYLNAADGSHDAWHGIQSNITAWAVDRENGAVFTGEGSGVVTRHDIKTNRAHWMGGVVVAKGISALRLSGADQLEVYSNDNIMRVHPRVGDRNPNADASAVDFKSKARAVASSNVTPGLSAVGTSNERVVVLKDGKIACDFNIGFQPFCMKFGIDDTKLYVGGRNSGVSVYSVDPASGTVTDDNNKLTAQGHVTQIVINSTGTTLVAIDNQKSINVFDMQNDNKCLNGGDFLRYHDMAINDAAWSPDGSKLATISADLQIIVWYNGPISKQRLSIPMTHDISGERIDWLDNTTLVSAGADRMIKTWTVSAEYVPA
jgi:WD40 repeat protein